MTDKGQILTSQGSRPLAYLILTMSLGDFPGGSVVKNLPCRRHGFGP